MRRNDGHREVLLGRSLCDGSLDGSGTALALAQPDPEHREAEHSDDEQDRESDPGERVAIAREVDDPQDETRRREQEVAQDERRTDPRPTFGSLAHAAAGEPDREQDEAAAGCDDPSDQRSPPHPFLLRASPADPINKTAAAGIP